MKDVHFAILGCGKIGSRHAEKLQNVKGASLAAVCDVIPDRADMIAKKYSAKAYYKIEDLLQDEVVDFVNVCTPSGLHPEHSIAALNVKRHVLCEKPMAFSEVDAKKMVEAAKRNKKFLFVVKQNRYNPPVVLVNQLLKAGKLGKPIKCVVNMFWNRNEDYYKSDSWRGTLALDGGTLYTQASHFVDLMLEFMGPPKSLYAVMGNYSHPKIEIEDTGIIAVDFKNGAVGSFNYTTCTTHKNFEGSILLVGTEGTVKIGGEYLNTIYKYWINGIVIDGPVENQIDQESALPYKLELSAEANNYGKYQGSMSNHDKVFQDIVAAINGKEGSGNLVSGEEAILAVKFMEKAMESAKTGAKVHFA